MSATAAIMKKQKEKADAAKAAGQTQEEVETQTVDTETTSEDTSETTAETTAVAETEAAKPTTKKAATKIKAKPKAATKDVATDLFMDIASDIENLTGDKAAAMLQEMLNSQASDEFKMGGVLAKIQVESWFGEYPNFRSYVEAEHGIKYRTAMTWIAMYNDIVESGVDYNKVKPLGWTKIAAIAPIMNNENIDAIFESASKMNTIEVRQFVSSFEGEAPSGDQAKQADTGEQIKTKSFKVFEGQKETIDLAIEKAKSASSTDSDSVALEYICTDYLANGAKKSTKALTATTTSIADQDGLSVDLEALFVKIRNESDSLTDAIGHILAAVENVYPSANISVELEETD